MIQWAFTVSQTERGWDVDGYSLDGQNVLPTSSYPNAVKCAARLLQLMEISVPVTPQDWPEAVMIGGKEE